jgi:hypothetical protein
MATEVLAPSLGYLDVGASHCPCPPNSNALPIAKRKRVLRPFRIVENRASVVLQVHLRECAIIVHIHCRVQL